ncbi:MAG: hypothetical protein M3417_05025 [Actinomycetota bacterium]|nr:hypothetical protein [Actinomycetota bacterium]
MSSLSPRVGRVRTLPVARLAGLLLAAVLGVHELRYLMAFGDQTESVLAHTGHCYLEAAVPFSGLVLAVGLAWCLLQAAARPAQDAGHPGMSRRRFWLLSSAALLVVFAGQELIEGLVSPGHPGGLAVVFGAGGWTVVPLVLALGGLVTLASGVVERAERTIGRARGSRQPLSLSWDRVQAPCVLVERTVRCALEGLARHLAGRGPPAVLLTR